MSSDSASILGRSRLHGVVRMSKLAEYRKFIAGLIGAVLGVGVGVLVPGIDPATATAISGSLTAILVVLAPANAPKTDK